MMDSITMTSVTNRALSFAIRAHCGQVRTGTQIPYAVHPLGVGQILRELYPDREWLEAAGYLHDVIEDTGRTALDLERMFGFRISSLVWAVTRDPKNNLEDYAADEDVMRLKSADVLDNVLFTIRGIRKGEDVWSRFNAGRRKVEYWRKISQMAAKALGVVDGSYPLAAPANGDYALLLRLDAAIEEVSLLAGQPQ